MSGPATAPPLGPVHGADLLDAGLMGHKFARLESMRRAGFPVPDLFGLPAAAFDLATAELRAALAPAPPAGDPAAVRAWALAAGAAAAALAVPEPLAARVLAAFDAMAGPDGLVAVRACVVPAPGLPGEDDGADPFAGMSESFLYVPRADLLDRVARCWASAYHPQAVHYRLHRGADPAATRVAVGVQRMVPGARSFVAFTRDPRDGSGRHIVAAAYGIGEGVVQERADIDHFFVTRPGGEVRSRLAHKRRMLGPPVPGGPSGPAPLEVPTALADRPVLDAAQLAQVTAAAERIEEHFGCPQDIEGAFTADGLLQVLQARPMVLPEPGAAPVRWSNHNITESYPGVSGALTYSLARAFYRSIFTDLYRRMGVPEERLRAQAHRLERMVGLHGGRVFYRIDDWYELHGQLKEFEFVRGWWEHAMGLAADPRIPLRPGWRRRALALAPATVRRLLRHPAEVRGFLRWWDALAASADGLDSRGPEELVAFHRRMWAQVAARWGTTLTNSFLTMQVTVVLDALLRRWAGQRDHALMTGLLAGGPENRSLAALRSGLALAELVGADPRARDRVLGARDAADRRAVWDELVGGGYGPDLARVAAEHLRRYGDRAAGDLKLEQPTPRQDPGMVLDMVGPLVRQGRTVEGSRADERRVRAAAEEQLRNSCRGPVRRAVLRALAALVRSQIKVREDTRFCRTELYGLSRRILRRLGALLAEAGHLDRAADVFDLTVEEVLGAFDGTLPGARPRELAALRRAERERCEARSAPATALVTAAGVPLAPAVPADGLDGADGPAEQDGVLRGLASSAGLVRARARVVLDSDVSPESCRDAILVARETDPGWLFLMTAASGLVVERGTLLSHTAITGRLLGVPTVVAVPGATARIADGAWVELDGGAGTVRLVEGPER
ncbi:PEP/pyruvate-binding domain-containing protein [Kitasatospora sp. KL5]|uniref:PEP/pyruvate-binding domain-containing protein n=1 Tax=Kitasatospora sp. KL5 TaxID=3425125 RepID=UPI003D6FCCEE